MITYSYSLYVATSHARNSSLTPSLSNSYSNYSPNLQAPPLKNPYPFALSPHNPNSKLIPYSQTNCKQMKQLFSSLILSLLLLLLLLLLSVAADDTDASPIIPTSPVLGPRPSPALGPTSPAGTISRTTHQQILATIPPGPPSSSAPFITSPSGKYSAVLLRSATAPGAGGFGNDFCYIQISDTETYTPLWESECAPMSTSNACSLVFSDDGLAIFDGSDSRWETDAQSADENALQRVELVDEGDMRIRDRSGELAWRASDEPRVGQRCGEPGSAGLAPALPPFAQPIGGQGQENLPFGHQGSGVVSGTFGFGNGQGPVGDEYSGSERGAGGSSPVGVVLGVCLLGFGFGFGV